MIKTPQKNLILIFAVSKYEDDDFKEEKKDLDNDSADGVDQVFLSQSLSDALGIVKEEYPKIGSYDKNLISETRRILHEDE